MSAMKNARTVISLFFAMVFLVPGVAAQTTSVPDYALQPQMRPAVPPWSCGAPRPLRILIAYSDISEPTQLRVSLQQNAAVGVVDALNIQSPEPTLDRLMRYDVVVAFTFSSLYDPVGTGDRLADYLDRLGIVVAFNNSWNGTGSELIQGRWLTGGYSPYNGGGTHLFSNGTLGNYTIGHPLMTDVASLNAYLRQTLTLSAGSTQVAAWNDGPPLIAAKGRAVGVSAYVGNYYSGQYSGDFDKIVVNAGYWLGTCKGYSPMILSYLTSPSRH